MVESIRQNVSAAITDAEVRSLAAKLQALSPALTPAERVLLHAVLGRASGREVAGGGVVGFTWRTTGNPFVSLAMIDLDAAARRDRRALVWRRLGELQ